MNDKHNYWYRLDNAAKLYPAIVGKKDSGVFRISVNLVNPIKPDILNQAVNDLKPRFPSMYVRLRPGLFWYYFETNEKMPVVKVETPFINDLIDLSNNNHYRFTIFYYDRRISLESFHSLCDGYGASEFIKAIVYRYLELLGYEMHDEGKVLTVNQKPKAEEIEDSFDKNYSKHIIKSEKEVKAYHIRDVHFPHYYDTAIINGKARVEELLALARRNKSTITEYLAALLTYSIYKSYKKDILLMKKPINLSIPVNLRRIFPSKTLRNFSLFFYTSTDFSDGDLKFSEILSLVKEDFKNKKDINKLQSNLNSNVAAEKNIFMKITPLFLKNIALRIASNILGNSLNTMTLSNIGNIDIPESMKEHVKDFGFSLAGGQTQPNGLAVISCNGIISLNFLRTIYDPCIEKYFFRFLAKKKINVTIESNMLEKYL